MVMAKDRRRRWGWRWLRGIRKGNVWGGDGVAMAWGEEEGWWLGRR
jgi:hypothetical protein